MVKAHLAFLLLGLGATQALVADNDRNRHWAEGVYFPPATGANAIQQGSTQSFGLTQPQHRKQNPWSTQDTGGIYNQTHMPQSIGFPADQYNPYQASEGFKHHYYSGENQLYVPETYSSTISDEYQADNAWMKYRDEGRWNTDRFNKGQYHSDPYYETNTDYRNGYHSNDNDRIHNSRVINAKSGRLSAYDSRYRYNTSNRPYVPGLTGMEYNEDYGNTFFPQGLILPFFDAEMPLLPLW